MKRHRMVWRRDGANSEVIAARDGCDGTVTNAGAELLSFLAANPRLSPLLQRQYPEFFQHCLDCEWLTSAGEVDVSVAEIPRGPHLKRVQVELTRHCNLRCGYCYSESGPHMRGRLTIADVSNVLSDAARLGCIWVDFTGGEPTMFPRWREAVSEARQNGLVVTIHTNGTTLTRDMARFLASADVRLVQVAVESHRPDIHDSIRGVTGALERTLRGIEAARSEGLNVRVALMGHKLNADHYRRAADWYMNTLGVRVILDRVVGTGGAQHTNTALTTAEFYEMVAPLLSRNVSVTRICESSDAANVVEPHCGVAASLVYVTADGEYALCPTMTSRETPFFRGPNISEMGLRDAWQSSDYFQAHRGTNCANVSKCPSGSKCGGGCRSNAYVETGRVDAPDVYNCNVHKNPTANFVDFLAEYSRGNFGTVPSARPQRT